MVSQSEEVWCQDQLVAVQLVQVVTRLAMDAVSVLEQQVTSQREDSVVIYALQRDVTVDLILAEDEWKHALVLVLDHGTWLEPALLRAYE